MEKNNKLKIAIYTICKNERQHVERWANSNTDADIRLVCDTGSTDGTKEALIANGITVVPITVSPWRFDSARNTSLNLLPLDVDICIYQDLDEVLEPGWRDELEAKWESTATIANHRYRNNNNPWQWHSKIHARQNCHWIGAVHETLKWSIPEHAIWIPEIYLSEIQDVSKDRTSYLNLLLKKINEGDKNWRTYYFLANDYQTQGDIDKSIDARIQSYEACDDGAVVKAYVAKHIASSYKIKNELDTAYKWLQTSIGQSPERESWFALAEFFSDKKDWDQCYIAAKQCINVTAKRDGFTYDPRAWSFVVYDIAALAAYNIGLHNKAVEYGKLALEMLPEDPRLIGNLNFYQEALNGQ
jgi:tetratricopeptide (TPR) repeat protein